MTLAAAACIKFIILVLAVHRCSSHMKLAKIIGGEYAAYGEFPYQLSVEYNFPEYGLFIPFCGATAISDSWALSAAHCMFIGGHRASPENITLRSGSLKKGENGSVHYVDDIIVHHKYDEGAADEAMYDADISLLKVKDKFSINPYVKFVRLPRQGHRLKVGTLTTAIGWGMIDAEMSESSPLLKKTVLSILNRTVCEKIPHFRRELRVTKYMICAAAVGTDTASGDSGGPLVTTDGSKHTQVGIVSWGSGTGQLDDPGLYTKVSAFRVWIRVKSGV